MKTYTYINRVLNPVKIKLDCNYIPTFDLKPEGIIFVGAKSIVKNATTIQIWFNLTIFKI